MLDDLLPRERFISIHPTLVKATGSWHIAGLLHELRWRHTEGDDFVKATYAKWAEWMIMSTDQVRRVIKQAVDMGVVEHFKEGAARWDHTTCLRIVPARLDELVASTRCGESATSTRVIRQIEDANPPDHDVANPPHLREEQEELFQEPVAASVDAGKSPSQRGNDFQKKFWSWCVDEHGKPPPYRAQALNAMFTALIKRGHTESELREVVKNRYLKGLPFTTAALAADMDGRRSTVREDRSKAQRDVIDRAHDVAPQVESQGVAMFDLLAAKNRRPDDPKELASGPQ